jgi:hypothetical protein
MKKNINLEALRSVIREEVFKGIPDFRFTQATEDYVEEIKKLMLQYILRDKSNAGVERQRAIAALNDTINELREELLATVKAKLEDIKMV